MSWVNQSLVIYHGTTAHALRAYELREGQPVLEFSVDLSLCRSATDFGKGFYVTTDEMQAEDWANLGVLKLRRAKKPTHTQAVVLRFEVDRDTLAQLDALVFVRDTPDLRSFVGFCRGLGTTHNRQARDTLYDIVYGPMTKYPARKVDEEKDQISFNTLASATALRNPIVSSLGGNTNGTINTNEFWSPQDETRVQ